MSRSRIESSDMHMNRLRRPMTEGTQAGAAVILSGSGRVPPIMKQAIHLETLPEDDHANAGEAV